MTKEVIYEEGRESLPLCDFVANMLATTRDFEGEIVVKVVRQGKLVRKYTYKAYAPQAFSLVGEESYEQPVQKDESN